MLRVLINAPVFLEKPHGIGKADYLRVVQSDLFFNNVLPLIIGFSQFRIGSSSITRHLVDIDIGYIFQGCLRIHIMRGEDLQ